MIIDIAAPAGIVLGAVRLTESEGSHVALLGAAVQHPPVNLVAERHAGLSVSGPRAEAGLAQLLKFQAGAPAANGIEAEIELAIPALMGLASDAMLGLSLARCLAWANDQPFDDVAALARGLGLTGLQGLFAWGFDRGGLLLVDTASTSAALPTLVRRAEVAHEEKQAWAFVLVLPHPPDDAPETLEDDRLRDLQRASVYLSPESSRILEGQLWPAVAADDFAAFGAALMAIRQLNDEALAQAGLAVLLTPEAEAVHGVLRDNGAAAWGQLATGLGSFGLVRGAQHSRDLRAALQRHVGYHGGTVMATIIDNQGARHVTKDRSLAQSEYRVG